MILVNLNKMVIEISRSTATKRKTPEEPNVDQTPFEVDIGRILFSIAYRLLCDKTQVLPINPNATKPEVLWPYRHRATHTQEVAHTAERIAKHLGLNPDLARAIALAHDLGHPPTGHAGEKTLDKILKKYGEIGFDHDEQTFRLVSKILTIRPEYCGLNLTSQVLTDLMSRAKRDHNNNIYLPEAYPQGYMSLEAQIVESADKLSFIIHDLEDAIMAGIITIDELRQCSLLNQFFNVLKTEMSATAYKNTHLLLFALKKWVYNYFLQSLYLQSETVHKYIRGRSFQNTQVLFITDQRLILCAPLVQDEFDTLLDWLYKNLYKGKMGDRDKKSEYTINKLFELLYENDELRTIYNQFGIKKDPNESLAKHITDLIVMSGETYIRKFNDNVLMA